MAADPETMRQLLQFSERKISEAISHQQSAPPTSRWLPNGRQSSRTAHRRVAGRHEISPEGGNTSKHEQPIQLASHLWVIGGMEYTPSDHVPCVFRRTQLHPH